MKYRFPLTSAFVAVLVISGLQIPSSAQMPETFSMASGMTKAQLTALGDSFDQSMTKAMEAGKTTTVTTTTSVSSTLAADGRYTCAKGGIITSTMTLRTVVTKSTGNATIAGSGRQTIANWKCVTGWIVNGNPYITYKISASIVGGVTKMIGTTSGAWKSTGPNKAKQSCQVKGTTTYSPDGKTGVATYSFICSPGGTTTVTEKF